MPRVPKICALHGPGSIARAVSPTRFSIWPRSDKTAENLWGVLPGQWVVGVLNHAPTPVAPIFRMFLETQASLRLVCRVGLGDKARRPDFRCGLSIEKSSFPAIRKRTVRIVVSRVYP
jgi:hypothetical protein